MVNLKDINCFIHLEIRSSRHTEMPKRRNLKKMASIRIPLMKSSNWSTCISTKNYLKLKSLMNTISSFLLRDPNKLGSSGWLAASIIKGSIIITLTKSTRRIMNLAMIWVSAEDSSWWWFTSRVKSGWNSIMGVFKEQILRRQQARSTGEEVSGPQFWLSTDKST